MSGLLIGTEFADRRGAPPALRLIASRALSAPYRDVAELLGYTVQLIDPDAAYLAALGRFMEAV